MPIKISEPWWKDKSQYTSEVSIPEGMVEEAGPNGIALVRLWDSGQTSSGWGLTSRDGSPAFLEKYDTDGFNPRRVLYGYERDKWAFAFVMRSMNIVAIDIDGKNGGLDHAEELLMGAPKTLAETSKSGNGFHLFYRTDDEWDPTAGFGAYEDHIGIVQGVDIRGVGCVYHHKPQRWNGEQIAELPKHIADRLKHKAMQRKMAHINIAKVLDTQDEEEILIMHDDIMSELAKPIPAGKRNTTLFAIGTKMKLAQVTDWETHLEKRADEVGLGANEIEKLVRNVQQYGV